MVAANLMKKYLDFMNRERAPLYFRVTGVCNLS